MSGALFNNLALNQRIRQLEQWLGTTPHGFVSSTPWGGPCGLHVLKDRWAPFLVETERKPRISGGSESYTQVGFCFRMFYFPSPRLKQMEGDWMVAFSLCRCHKSMLTREREERENSCNLPRCLCGFSKWTPFLSVAQGKPKRNQLVPGTQFPCPCRRPRKAVRSRRQIAATPFSRRRTGSRLGPMFLLAREPWILLARRPT